MRRSLREHLATEWQRVPQDMRDMVFAWLPVLFLCTVLITTALVFHFTLPALGPALSFMLLLLASAGAGVAQAITIMRRMRAARSNEASLLLAESEMERVNARDPLTGLLNRPALLQEIDRLALAHPSDCITALVLDLDRFRPINDLFSQEGGDTALRVLGHRLAAAMDGVGSAARLGADEFACILAHPEESDAPERLAEALLRRIARPVQLRGGMVEVTASIGIHTARPCDVHAVTLLQGAGFAMRQAKRRSRGGYQFFTSEMAAAMRDQAQLEIDLPAAIRREEIIPYFQPIVDLSSGRISGFECLARWRHPTRGLLAPDLFIPVAEEAGVIQELGLTLLRRACMEARQWPHELMLSVNISPLQLNDAWLPEQVLRVLCVTGFAPGRLIVEITESHLLGDLGTARAILESLKNAGVRIALDDFGTGYAGLKHLRELRFDRIKIDRSFIQHLDEEQNILIVQAMLRMCDGLGIPATAEGVETHETAVMLRDMGCSYGQGYLFGAAIDPESALALAQESGEASPSVRNPEPRAILPTRGRIPAPVRGWPSTSPATSIQTAEINHTAH